MKIISGKRLCCGLFLGLLLSASAGADPLEWNLPIKLGQSSAEVRRVLGTPSERLNPEVFEKLSPDLAKKWKNKTPNLTEEWYYSSGIVARYEQEILFSITLHSYSEYRGFLAYTDRIIGNVRLGDTKEKIIAALGPPTKVESDELQEDIDVSKLLEQADVHSKKKGNINPDDPVVWPAHERFYWKREHYVVEVTFLKQAQSVSKGLVHPRGKITTIQVYR